MMMMMKDGGNRRGGQRRSGQWDDGVHLTLLSWTTA